VRTTPRSVEPQAQELLDILVAALQRPSASSTRARAALSALEALLCSASPSALSPPPYERYPSLLDTLLASVATEQSEGARRSVARVLGVLGALEPRKYRDGVARGAGDRSSPRLRRLPPTRSEGGSARPEA